MSRYYQAVYIRATEKDIGKRIRTIANKQLDLESIKAQGKTIGYPLMNGKGQDVSKITKAGKRKIHIYDNDTLI